LTAIKYVCLSDLHFGADAALMTNAPGSDEAAGTGSNALRSAFCAAFVATLNALKLDQSAETVAPSKPLPGLILLGDIFDLSLGTPQSSIDTFDAFVKSLAKAGGHDALGDFIFVPGNHDHELWTVTRYQNMVGRTRADDTYQHTTPAFTHPDSLPKAALIDTILRENNFPGATTFYPNMGMASDKEDDNGNKTLDKIVVLHHGHFIESMYCAMSSLNALLSGGDEIAYDAEDLERLNASWIDFVWSSDGDNGELGRQIGLLHDALMTGGEDLRFDQRLARVLADKLTETLPIPHTSLAREWIRNAAKAVVDSSLGRYGQMERFSYFELLSAASIAGLGTYLADTVMAQVDTELNTDKTKDLAVAQADVSFVFGHTHKPFETRLSVRGLARPAAIYNTGGWDMDTPMFGTLLGAAAVFIDEDLNVASLRLCDVPQQNGSASEPADIVPVRVATADGDIRNNPLAEALQAAINGTTQDGDIKALWHDFSELAAAAYRTKQDLIMAELHGRDAPQKNKDGAL
jgi:hypothetical protein